jgi:hypothetical protein
MSQSHHVRTFTPYQQVIKRIVLGKVLWIEDGKTDKTFLQAKSKKYINFIVDNVHSVRYDIHDVSAVSFSGTAHRSRVGPCGV